MVNTYIMVNPYIEGSFEKSIKAKNSIEAGKLLYTSLSEHFNNNVPKFLFTIQKGGSGKGKYYSFKVKEDKLNDEINFSIEPYTVKDEMNVYKNIQKNITDFQNKINVKAQTGGAKKAKDSKKTKTAKKTKDTKKAKTSKKAKDSSDDSDIEDNFEFDADEDFDLDDSPKYNKKSVQRYMPNGNYPISHWYYDPYLYRLNSMYVPTFYSYVIPYVEILLR